jgi:hypothetical protein
MNDSKYESNDQVHRNTARCRASGAARDGRENRDFAHRHRDVVSYTSTVATDTA